jgi:hypothetical protein
MKFVGASGHDLQHVATKEFKDAPAFLLIGAFVGA